MHRRDILERAIQATCGERDATYGDPADCFAAIALLWSDYLERPISPRDVAVCLGLLKVARIKASPDHEDNYVDGAAYLAIAGELASDRSESST